MEFTAEFQYIRVPSALLRHFQEVFFHIEKFKLDGIYQTVSCQW